MNGEGVRVACDREVPASVEQVDHVLQDPGSYTDWVEGLARFEPCDDGSWLGEVGYLGRRKQRRMRRLDTQPGAIAWETCDPETSRSRIRWEVRAARAGSGSSRVHFAWEKSGSGSVFGASASSPLLKAALRVLADRSLEHLERAVTGAAEETRPAVGTYGPRDGGDSIPDWGRIRAYYDIFNDPGQVRAAVARVAGDDDVSSPEAVGTLDFIDSPFSAHLILSSFRLDRDAWVLDVGAGLGGSSRLYASTGARVTAVDVLEEQVRAHRELNEAFGARNIEVVHADAQSLPFPDRTFTHYFSVGALCHTFDRRAALSEAHRVLRPGGMLAIVDCTAGPAPGPEYWGQRFWKLIPDAEYLALARDVGFDDAEISDLRAEYATQVQLYMRLIENTPEIFEVRFGGEQGMHAALESYRGYLEGFQSERVGVVWLRGSRRQVPAPERRTATPTAAG